MTDTSSSPLSRITPPQLVINLSRYGMLIGAVILAVIGGKVLFASPSASPNAISVAGVATQTFPVEKARIVFSYTRKKNDRIFLISSSQQEFSLLADSLRQLTSDPIITTDPVIGTSALDSSQTEYKTLGEVTVPISALNDTQSLLINYSVNIIQTVLLPAESDQASTELMESAIQDAHNKASALAQKSKQRLGKVLAISEVTPSSGAQAQLSGARRAESQDSSVAEVELTQTYNVSYKINPWWMIW